jgi:hypothetical protein
VIGIALENVGVNHKALAAAPFFQKSARKHFLEHKIQPIVVGRIGLSASSTALINPKWRLSNSIERTQWQT